MTIERTRVIRILDAQAGTFREEAPPSDEVQIDESRIPYPRDRRGRMTVDPENVELQEAPGGLSTANFPDLLRSGIQFDAFTAYAEATVTYPSWCRVVDSNKQQEEYLFDSPIGLLPVVPEGEFYPSATTDLDSGLIIRNHKYGMTVRVTEEMRRFDQVGKVRELAELLGRAARLTEEQKAMDVLTTTGNYTLNNTNGDNDETVTGSGANTQALTFSPAGLITAFNILRTMKDRKTGVYRNVMPDTLIVTPKLWWAAQKLIGSPDAIRVGDAGSAAESYGTGTRNTFFNAVRTIIVSPQFGNTFQWALLEGRRAFTFQRVDPVQILIGSSDASSKEYMDRDVIPYRVRNWFGVGLRDQHYAFFSSSTTAPAVD